MIDSSGRASLETSILLISLLKMQPLFEFFCWDHLGAPRWSPHKHNKVVWVQKSNQTVTEAKVKMKCMKNKTTSSRNIYPNTWREPMSRLKSKFELLHRAPPSLSSSMDFIRLSQTGYNRWTHPPIGFWTLHLFWSQSCFDKQVCALCQANGN